MSTLVRNALILIACLVVSIWAIYPPEAKLRRGKDLAGGVTLVYQVEIRPTDPPDTLSKVLSNVKERLDPQGVLDLQIVPQGSNRLEISMPLPSEKVKALQAAFEEKLRGVSTTTLTRDNLERIAVLPEPARGEELKRYAGGDASRLERLTKAASDFVAVREARARFDALAVEIQGLEDKIRNAGGELSTDPLTQGLRDALRLKTDERAKLASDAAKVAINYEGSLSSALAIGLNPGDLRRALSLSDKDFRIRKKDGTVATLESPRKRALDEIFRRYPDQKPAIDEAIKSWGLYQAERRSLDDPEDVVRILRGSGVLDFRITVSPGEFINEGELRAQLREGGPRNVKSDEARFYKVNRIESWVETVEDMEAIKASPAAFFLQRNLIAEEYKGEFYILCWDKRGMRLTKDDGDTWEVSRAFPGNDQIGRPAIDFQMNPGGAEKLGELTGRHTGRAMAVLLDDQVYTAPTLQSRISSNGQISGNFPQAEIDYILRVLNAGSMAAKLSPEPISRSVIGPSLGADNLRMGMDAAVISFIAVGVFIIGYYFLYGAIAMVALVFNALLIVAAMALNHAAFTLPGIAGIILTFGQAVDANVLVYERIREEFRNGHDMRTAVRLGFHRAMSAIVDGNVTSLIVCVVLGLTGTQEIKGFALTLGIGTVTTLFAQLFFSRFIFTILVDKLRMRSASMLPMVGNNWLGNRLIPSIDWMGLRHVSYVVSIALMGVGVFFLFYKGENLLGTEFRGGTSATLVLKPDPSATVAPGQEPSRLTMKRPEVEDRVHAIAGTPGLEQFRFAEVIAVNPENDGFTSSTFTIKVLPLSAEDESDAPRVQKALIDAFADKLDVQPSLGFTDSGLPAERAPVFPVSSRTLANVIDRPGVTGEVSAFEGGAAVLLENISPAVSKSSMQVRLEGARAKADFADISGRTWELRVLSGSDNAVGSAVVLIRDPDIRPEDVRRWETEIRDREWEWIRTALTQTQTLAQVQSFSPAVAKTFQAQAWTATILSTLLIIIYIWVRFNSFRYSAAAIATTLHDCLVAIGFVALATVLYEASATKGFAGAVGILPFKIDLNVMAAILTTLGYSLNDTIIIMDRIRELRGKRPYASRQIINDAINQTISRTLITAGTTFIAVMVLYIFGGEGVRVFAYTMLIGLIIGTYSSIAVAAPLVWVRSADPHGNTPDSAGASRGTSDAPVPAQAA